MSEASPLGRYVVGDPTAELVEVRLLGCPLELLVAGREHHDGLMREFRLLALSGQADAEAAPTRLVELTRVLGQQYASAANRRDEEVDEALARGERTADLVYLVPPAVVGAATALDRLMVEADEHCRAEQLMTLERPAVLKELASWYLGQFVDQVGGRPPTPWTGPLVLDGA